MSITLRKNESFEKLDKEFKEKFINGVNFLSHEELELSHEIHSDDLSFDEKELIRRKCKNDFWFFMKYVAKRRAYPEGSDCAEMYINKANVASLYLSLKGVNNYSNNVRQTFSSWTKALFILWKILFAEHDISINLLSPGRSNSSMIIERVIELNSLLPNYLSVSKSLLISKLYILPNPRDFKHAKQIGETVTGDILYIEDFEYIDFIDVMFPRFKTTSKLSNMLILGHSSVGEYKSKSKETADKLIKSAYRWEDLMYNLKLEKENSPMVYIKYEYTEIVENPEKFIREQRIYLNKDEDAINREILLIRNIQDGGSNV